MFTGIIEEIGSVKKIKRSHKSMEISIQANTVLDQTQLGDSISCNGVCLTVTSLTPNSFTADIMHETFKSTTLKNLSINSPINLERALTIDKRLGGHIVTGHIDTTARITNKIKKSNAIDYHFKLTKHNYQINNKDSIAIDGISLTIQEVQNDTFKVSIIPHTLDETILKNKRIGDYVNIEFDTLKKKELPKSNITLSLLQQNGFV